MKKKSLPNICVGLFLLFCYMLIRIRLCFISQVYLIIIRSIISLRYINDMIKPIMRKINNQLRATEKKN